jgi:hypothetical protein
LQNPKPSRRSTTQAAKNRVLNRGWWLAWAAAVLVASAGRLHAQGTTGAIEGKVADELGLSLPGAVATARNQVTGLSRTGMSDSNGLFRILGLPVGTYHLRVDLTGFAAADRDVVVNVGATTASEFRLRLAGQNEELTVRSDAAFFDPSNSGVGEIVTGSLMENLPLNGRQFGNVAALVPGVSLGFHPDPTKSTQFAPQVNGGSGRNVNYLIDGGDNNDDTVGGLVQMFPLDSIGEFNFETQRFRADTGRSNGGTLKVVTKSGTNRWAGSAFELFRDKSLNARTTTEKNNGVPKGDYRRHQFGGSLGGPVVRDQIHFFAAFERIVQDTTQSVTTLGLFPEKDGVYDTPYRESMAVAKAAWQIDPSHYLSVRYGWNDSRQTYGADPLAPPESWGNSKNRFHSANANINSVLDQTRRNEFVFQFSYFNNAITENSNLPTEKFPNGVMVGQSINTPQSTLQKKFQFRDDFTWTTPRHEFKVGASFIYEPVLEVMFSTGRQPQYAHLESSRSSRIANITFNGSIGGGGGENIGSIPNNQYAIYIQDSFRVTRRLLLDLGLRYDLTTGFAFDQEANVVFAELQAAGAAGVFARTGLPCPCPGFEDFGKEPKEDKDNLAPRVGFTFDASGDGRLLARGGFGRYYDFAYTNANILFAVTGAQSSFGTIYLNNDTSGIRNPDGSYFQVGQPLPPNQLAGARKPLPLHAASPRIEQPYHDQANLGLTYDLGGGYALELDGVYSSGHDLGTPSNLNLRIDGGSRRLAGILPQSGTVPFRVDTSDGVAHYKGLNLALKKRWDGRLQVMAWYSLSKATSSASTQATDEFADHNVLDMFDPFSDRQEAVVRTDARHRITVSGSFAPGAGFLVAPVFRYRSKTPYTVLSGKDTNRDGTLTNDFPAGITQYNAARGSAFTQLDLRVSKRFRVGRGGLELIGEVFNVFNARNPDGYGSSDVDPHVAEPSTFAGDFQRGEQRLAQIGLRVEF